MPPAAADRTTRYVQGIPVAAESIRPEEFFARTRRHTTLEKAKPFNGNGLSDIIEIRKADILGGILVRFTGSLVVTIPTGTVTSTVRWPYDWLRFKLTANGQSNLINARGLKLKCREIMKKGDLADRGVVQTIGGVARNQGTLALASESWGVGSMSALTAGTYGVDLEVYVPVAEDEIDLAGAIMCATSSTDITLEIVYDSLANMFVTSGGATVALTGSIQVTSTKFAIPIGADGEMVLPELDTFHSIIEQRDSSVQNGDNESRVIGQGAGKSLLRLWYQVMSGAGANAAPLSMNASNFGRQSWRYAGNETPDEFQDGQHLRESNERAYNADIGAYWGFGCHDFASENSFRDVVNLGQTSEFRVAYNIPNGVTLASPALEYAYETIYAADEAA